MARMAEYNPVIDIQLICQKLMELENRLSEVELTLLGLSKETKQNKTIQNNTKQRRNND